MNRSGSAQSDFSARPLALVRTAGAARREAGLVAAALSAIGLHIVDDTVFFIYGEHGQGGTETRPNNAFYAAAHEPKQIWEVPGGQHIAGIITRPAEYEQRVLAFFDRYLLPTT